MRGAALLAAVGIMALAAPALAEDSGGAMAAGGGMGTMSMMEGGSVVAVMPDGHMGTMMADQMQTDSMMKMVKPIDHCMMMMMGKDGKMYMIDTSSADAIKSCEGMAVAK
jgi:hypothetical protein